LSEPGRVAIHYRRPPDRLRVYDQRVVLEREDVIVTLSEPVELRHPMTLDERVMLEQDSIVVWFTFPGLWHDIGRFHRADGTFSGLYANILTPVRIDGRRWDTTDLYLDVWWPPGAPIRVLDEDELEDALAAGHIDEARASRAREEAVRIVDLAVDGRWPPPVVKEWTLARALNAVDGSGRGAD
jgi:predicted RNA-binding protein associated with RNAse of E/G family